MKKTLLLMTLLVLASQNVFAESVFDSDDTPTEVKLVPAISTTKAKTVGSSSTSSQLTSTVSKTQNQSIKEVKYNNALTNLDDAQVELRQELSLLKVRYEDAKIEKDKAIQNCKNLKRQINEIEAKMSNIDKSKKMINRNLDEMN